MFITLKTAISCDGTASGHLASLFCGAQSQTSDARNFHRDFRKPSRAIRWRRRAAAAAAVAQAILQARACRRTARAVTRCCSTASRCGRRCAGRWRRRRARLAEAIAAEWNAQDKSIDPARMPLTRLANAVIDAVADAPSAVAEEIEKYLGSDLVLLSRRGAGGTGRAAGARLGIRCWPGHARRSAPASCRSRA